MAGLPWSPMYPIGWYPHTPDYLLSYYVEAYDRIRFIEPNKLLSAELDNKTIPCIALVDSPSIK